MAGRLRGLVLGLMIALAGIAAIALPAGSALEESIGLHWLFNARGPVDAPRDVVIIAIDELSTRKLGLPDKPRDWPRNLHAELVRYLAQAGARVITFDLTFDTPGIQAASDRAFAEAIAQAGNVLIADSLRKETIRIPGPGGEPIGSALVERPAPPIAALEHAAAGHAPFLLPKGSRVSAYWTFINGAGDAPTLPALAVHFFAHEAFGDLVALLREEAPDLAPPAPAPELNAAGVRRSLGMARAARDALLRDPAARERMVQRLRDDPDHELGRERKRLVASLLNLYASDETSYLNFYGPPRSIETISYHRVLEAARALDGVAAETLDAGRFRNKAVFIGFSAASEAGQAALHDDYRTVYSRSSGHDISGVEIAATAFANALDARQLRPVAAGWQITLVAAWGLLLGVACRSLRPLHAAGVVAMLAAAFLWVVYSRFDAAAVWWLSVVPVGLQAPLALFAGVWLNDRDTRREREAIRRAFGQFLPGTVVDQLARNVGRATASNRVVFGACLATDAEQYTALAEQTAPGALGELMNAYYARLFEPVERSGGVVIDVVGDAMVAIWAGAMSDVDLRTNACRSALEIVDAVARSRDTPHAGSLLPTRVGVHSGDMLIGSVGASRHYEYRAVGDIVNTASRIQGLNKALGTRALASQQTVDGLDRFAVRPLGSFLLAGKSTAVSVVELVGAAGDLDPGVSSLCEAFAAALEAYRSGQWREAAGRFSDILRRVPDDGPARFYRERCEHLLAHPPAAPWTPTIRVDVK